MVVWLSGTLDSGADPNTQLNMHRSGRGGNSARFTDDLLTVGATPLLRAHGARTDIVDALGKLPPYAANGKAGGRDCKADPEIQTLVANAK